MRAGQAAVAVLIVIVMAPLALAPVCAEDESVSIYGYVADLSYEKGDTPLFGVTVSVLNSLRESIAVSETTADGRFDLTYDRSVGRYLYFEKTGYILTKAPINLEISSDNTLTLDYSTAITDSDGKLRITTSVSGQSPIGMDVAQTSITGVVMSVVDGDSSPMSDATVTIKDSNGVVQTLITDSDGRFSIDCDAGLYEVSVEKKGFEEFTQSDVVASVDPSPLQISMYPRSHGNLWGVDTPHALELIGIVVIAILIVSCFFLYRAAKTTNTGLVLVNDLEDEERDQ
ncbi:MAG: carboxypeptidase regulatory-like domain-containing protein [Candidatus Methanomethylophilaceae archaeon]|nr:carboxypeptidase regulatory-like domain-containing protein [Candidatus Methanomethylophilaceae archaeon]